MFAKHFAKLFLFALALPLVALPAASGVAYAAESKA